MAIIELNGLGILSSQIIANMYQCERCQHKWLPRFEEKPIVCPKCKSPYWDKKLGEKQ